MTGRGFLIGLAKRVFIFAVVIPGAFVGLLFALGPGSSSPAVGLGYLGYFIGIPIWIICTSVALWWLFGARMRFMGMPSAFSLIVIPFVLADWRFFLWLFRPFYAPFLLTIVLMITALVLWPDRAHRGETTSAYKKALIVLGGCLALQVVLALASIVGSVGFFLNATRGAFLLAGYAGHYALLWNGAIAAAMVWALVEARRMPPDISPAADVVSRIPTRASVKPAAPRTFGTR